MQPAQGPRTKLCFECAETSLRKMLHNTIGANKMTSITVTELMVEIEKAAVEKQSNLLNKVKLMEAKQERDEPVRTFVARLRGLANICNPFFATQDP